MSLLARHLALAAGIDLVTVPCSSRTAIEWLHAGKVHIAVRAENGRVRIEVSDNGPGIPEADRQRVKERFVRLEKSRTEPGSGLGLSLVDAVARLHRGELRLEDNAPGVRAVIDLPAT